MFATPLCGRVAADCCENVVATLGRKEWLYRQYYNVLRNVLSMHVAVSDAITVIYISLTYGLE